MVAPNNPLALFFLPVPPAERRRALLCVLLFALLMASYYVFKPVRGSLYIHYIGAQNLPYAYLASVALAALVMAIYNRVFVQVGARRLLAGAVAVLAASALLLWIVFAAGLVAPAPLSLILFMWVSVYGTLASTLFWSLANDSFDAKTGRAVYGVVGTGGIIGAFIGSSATSLLVSKAALKSESLLLVGACMLLVTLPLISLVRAGSRADEAEQAAPTERLTTTTASKRRDGLHWILRDRYVAAMAALVFLITFAGTFLDLQYNRIVSDALPAKAAKTAFFGRLYAMVNALGLAVQIFVTGPLHRRAGPVSGLYALPTIGLVAPIVLLWHPSLTAITITWTLGMALLYSLNQSSKEQLYIPTPPDVRYGAKGYIDVVCFRLGDGLASLAALIFKAAFDRHSPWLSAVLLLVVVVWLALVRWLGPRYRERVAAL
ncbi:MAG: hypothetical protein KC503_04565 [Myxococcales bacterium]|nr:hypothetical protein [Myxococcales bacterium]